MPTLSLIEILEGISDDYTYETQLYNNCIALEDDEYDETYITLHNVLNKVIEFQQYELALSENSFSENCSIFFSAFYNPYTSIIIQNKYHVRFETTDIATVSMAHYNTSLRIAIPEYKHAGAHSSKIYSQTNLKQNLPSNVFIPTPFKSEIKQPCAVKAIMHYSDQVNIKYKNENLNKYFLHKNSSNLPNSIVRWFLYQAKISRY